MPVGGAAAQYARARIRAVRHLCGSECRLWWSHSELRDAHGRARPLTKTHRTDYGVALDNAVVPTISVTYVWAVLYSPRSHNRKVWFASQRGTTGRRLSLVEFSVRGAHCHVAPLSQVTPMKISCF